MNVMSWTRKVFQIPLLPSKPFHSPHSSSKYSFKTSHGLVEQVLMKDGLWCVTLFIGWMLDAFGWMLVKIVGNTSVLLLKWRYVLSTIFTHFFTLAIVECSWYKNAVNVRRVDRYIAWVVHYISWGMLLSLFRKIPKIPKTSSWWILTHERSFWDTC